MKNPFLKYVMKEKKEDVFHSSEYGKAQSAEAMGAASTESFGERMKMEQNRRIVQGYNDSRIVNGAYANGPRAKKYVPPEKKDVVGVDKAGKLAGGGVATSATPAVSPTMTAVKKSFVPPIKPKFGA